MILEMSDGVTKAFGQSQITWINGTITATVSSLLNELESFDKIYNDASSNAKASFYGSMISSVSQGFIHGLGKQIQPAEYVVKLVSIPLINSISVKGWYSSLRMFRVSDMVFHASQGSTVGTILAF